MNPGRVLITGMGGELGAHVASLIEREHWAGEILGLDVDPPRRRLRRCDFRLVEPTDGARINALITEYAPTVVVHLAVYEPEARASAREASRWTPAFAEAAFAAIAGLGNLHTLVVRSGIEVYGVDGVEPDVYTPPRPTTPFGRELLGVETAARRLVAATDAHLAIIRLAPVIGPHVPSPLGRVLRQPVVPCPLLRNPRFAVLGERDAAEVIAAAAAHRFHGVLNAVADGTIGVREAIRIGGHLPTPLVGPQWLLARPLSHVLGAPIPDHVHELLTRGRRAIGSDLGAIGVTLRRSTAEVIAALHTWEPVTRSVPSRDQPPAGRAAAGTATDGARR